MFYGIGSLIGPLYPMLLQKIGFHWTYSYLFLAVVVLISFGAYWGLGLVVGGLALLFKRVSSLSQLLSFAFMGVMVLPIDKINQVAFLPGGAGRYFLNNIVVNHARICQIPIYEWAYLIIPNIIYKILLS